MPNICTQCECTPAETMADALALGLQEECQARVYTCCQIAEWAGEQWQAWTEAAIEDADACSGTTRSASVADPDLERFLLRSRTEVPNWDAVAKLFDIAFMDC